MKKYFVFGLLLLILASFTPADKRVRIFIAGDSTAQTYTESKDGLIKGWGQMLSMFFNEKVEIVNYAMGGRSTKSFIAEGRWERLLSKVHKGDYVFIQFGHNDASSRPERHASYEEYKANLKRMIADVRRKKGNPVLLTSVVMRTFSNNNLTDDRLKGYPVITRRVAKEENVPLIDINLKTRDFITMLGDEASKAYYRWAEPGIDPTQEKGIKDDTHMMEKGAIQVASFVAEGIKELHLKNLSKYLNLSNVSNKEHSVYLFSYFKGKGDGLHLAYSRDGLKWDALFNDSVILQPQIGKDKLMRDPSIVQGEDGTFHLVWTCGWWDKGIGYASSKDLKKWSVQRYIPVMEKFKGVKNTWAPELFYDKKSRTFYIVWASTVTGAFPDLPTTESEKGLNHRLYYVTTKDFNSFSKTKLFFDPGFSVIDGTIMKRNNLYYLFVKNENTVPAEKNIRMTISKKPYKFPIKVSPRITGEYWAEGPAPLQVNNSVYVYFDKYRDKKFGAVRTYDLTNWEDISESVSFPAGIRHGTAFSVSEEFFTTLEK